MNGGSIMKEFIATYGSTIIYAVLTALAGFLGMQLKKLYEKYVNDKTKEAVVRTCVKAAEQLYHDLDGPEKLRKAQEGIRQMLEEKGISISELEMNALIEACVSEFNYGFGIRDEPGTPETPEPEAPEEDASQVAEYSEEGGASA